MKEKYLLPIVIFTSIFFSNISFGQRITFMSKLETGYYNFLNHTLVVDPGPGWKGYYLKEDTNAFNISSVNGISFFDRRTFVGAGIGYLNFNGVHGVTLFAEIEHIFQKTKFSPFVYTQIGHSHIWNQYENGTGTTLVNFGLGLNYKLSDNFGIYFKTGLLYTQQSSFLPMVIGIRF